MAILTGTAKNRFASITDKTSNLSDAVADSINSLQTFLKVVDDVGSAATQTSMRSFTEDGLYEGPTIISSGQANVADKIPSQRRQIAQRPKTTVFIKKKQFASLAGNNDISLLDDEERTYLRCVKRLMRRKCDEIAFHESLINISSIYETSGFLMTAENLFDGAVDSLINVLGSLSGVSGILSGIASDSLVSGGGATGLDTFAVGLQALYRAKQKNERSKASSFTRWVDDPAESNYSGLGPGTGTIEFNMVSSIDTTCALNSGSASMQIEDPYQLMLISAQDIENAIHSELSRGAILPYDGTASLRLGLATNADRKLNAGRRARGEREINFEFIEGKVAATLGFVGLGVQDGIEVPRFYQWIGEFTSPESVQEAREVGITREEIALINQIMIHLAEYIQATSVSKSGLIDGIIDAFDNYDSKYDSTVSRLRERLRRDFLGQHIIQPMDQVTIFANSNTYDITPASGIVDVLSETSAKLTDMMDPELLNQESRDMLGGDVGAGLDFLVGSLYSSIRKKNIFRDDGVCIFSGLAESIRDTYSADSGKFTVAVSCAPNTEYLKISRFTLKPDLNNTFGVVNDPLTPFDLDDAIDPGTGLIVKDQLNLSKTNLERLEFLRIPSGPMVSQKMRSVGDILSDKRDGLAIITHTPGLVYKWKEGIISATLNEDGGKGAFGGITALDQPFAKLDAANIASILITGQPYDYSTFLEGISKVSGNGSDPTNLSRDFFNYLFEYTDRVKKYYGNFIPAKDRTLDRDTVLAYYQVKNSVSALNTLANNKISKLRQLRNKQPSAENNPAESQQLKNDIAALSAQIADLQQKALPNGISISLEGNNTFLSISDSLNRVQTDREIAYKIKRKPEDVRFNQDNNYFIVPTSYDTDFLIQAFAASLGNFKMYDAEYSSPYSIIENAASALQLEFFADPDGNLVLRPPRYNRTPLSLMLEMIRQAPAGETSFLPKFVRNVLKSKYDSIMTALFKNELNIAKAIFSLGMESTPVPGTGSTESRVAPFIKLEGQRYIVDDSAVEAEIKRVFAPQRPEQQGASNFIFGPLSKVTTSESVKSVAPDNPITSNLANVLLTIKVENGEPESDALREKTTKEAQDLIKRLDSPDAVVYASSKINEISGFLNNRRALIRSLYDNSKRFNSGNIDTGLGFASAVASFAGTEVNASLMSFTSMINGTTGLSPALEEMVENDLTNLDGPGSGKRYIINDAVVLSGAFSHQPPDFNNITVNGAQDYLEASEGKIGGLPITTASATDFDSWRQYGFRQGSPMRRPDMTSADIQCAPFASLMLATQRRSIHKGSVTVIGNEYYRPGDNVYLSYRNMIYYVTSVSHNIDMNSGSFTTSLELGYGRPPGDIIPTPIDIIGAAPSGIAFLGKKYRKANTEDKEKQQTSSSIKVINLGTVHISPAIRSRISSDESFANDRIKSIIQNANGRAIRSIALKARARTVMTPKSGRTARIEVRGYYVDAKGSTAATKICTAIREQLIAIISGGTAAPASQKEDLNSSAQGTAPTPPSPGATLPFAITISTIDLLKETPDEKRYELPFPSEAAWTSASQVEYEASADSKKTVDLPVNAFDVVFII